MLSPGSAYGFVLTHEPPLLPRYRRLFSFGDVLDESIQLFRSHWLTFALVSAICLLPPGLVSVWFSASGAFDTLPIVQAAQRGGPIDPASLAGLGTAFAISGLLYMFFYLAWTLAVIVTTDAYLHTVEMRVLEIFGRALRRYVPALLGGLVLLIAGLLLVIAAFIPFIIPPVGLLGAVCAIVGLIVWWTRPGARKTWLKWFLIVLTPFGLPAYFWGVWSMFLCAVALEGKGPIGCLKRSAQLVDRQWFRAVGVLTVGGLIVGVLQSVPSYLIQIPLSVSAASRGQVGLGPTEFAVSTAVSVAIHILLSSLGTIIYTLLFIDLRNRREGTDIAERLSQLEGAFAAR